MNIKDAYVLEHLNKLIALHRFNKIQILNTVKLISISKDIDELLENMEWEDVNKKYKTNIKI